MMKMTKFVNFFNAFIVLSIYMISVNAQQAHVYNQPLPAEEMGRLLFGTKPEIVSGTRQLKISAKTNNTPTSPSERNSVAYPIEFAFNSSEIMESAKPFLDEIGKMLASQNFAERSLIVEGHTDAKGPDNYNRYLSERRAKAVSNYLVQNHGISSSRLKVVGLGKTKPLPSTDPFDEINRRVEFYSAN